MPLAPCVWYHTMRCCSTRSARLTPAPDPRLSVERIRSDAAAATGHRGGIRQERGRLSGIAGARIRLGRDRNSHAGTSGRKPQTAGFSTSRGPWFDQSNGLSQPGGGSGRQQPHSVATAKPSGGMQYRSQQSCRRRGSRAGGLRAGVETSSPILLVCRGEHLIAEHAGIAVSSAGGRAGGDSRRPFARNATIASVVHSCSRSHPI